MKLLTMLWFDTPRWVRGLFLGNLCYIVYAVLAFSLLSHNINFPVMWFLLPILLPFADTPIDSRIYLYHLLCCVLGAVLVQLFGEKRGVAILVGGLYATSAAVIIYFLIQFSMSE